MLINNNIVFAFCATKWTAVETMRAFTASPTTELNPHVFTRTIKFMSYRTKVTRNVTYMPTSHGLATLMVNDSSHLFTSHLSLNYFTFFLCHRF